jgi:hypothetical protein
MCLWARLSSKLLISLPSQMKSAMLPEALATTLRSEKLWPRNHYPLRDLGETKQSFTIHKALFEDRSGLLADSVRFGEPDPTELIVEGDDIGVMNLYVQFLYAGRLPIRDSTKSTDEYAALCKHTHSRPNLGTLSQRMPHLARSML